MTRAQPGIELDDKFEIYRDKVRVPEYFLFDPATSRWLPTPGEAQEEAEREREKAEVEREKAEARSRQAETLRQEAEAEAERLRRELDGLRRRLAE